MTKYKVHVATFVTEDGDNCLVGVYPTEDEAIDDLMSKHLTENEKPYENEIRKTLKTQRKCWVDSSGYTLVLNEGTFNPKPCL